jgi:hypothetical protein
MSKYCGSTGKATKLNCPACTSVAAPVAYQTVLHHLCHPYNLELPQGAYYFCGESECNIVYFEETGESFSANKVRGVVGQKSSSPDRPICYCFDVSALQIENEVKETGASPSKKRVIGLTQENLCNCEIRNPSGKCCLADFKTIEKIQNEC